MPLALTDTDILSLFLHNHPAVVVHMTAYLAEYGQVNISLLTYYEILSGLLHRDAQTQLAAFRTFAAESVVLPLTDQSVTVAADRYALLRKAGTPVDDIDLLIAGVAIANNLQLVTRNQRHFQRIPGLLLADWTIETE